VTLHAGVSDLVRMAAGEVHPVRALFEGRLHVDGDFFLAARLPEMFGAVEPIEGLAQASVR
jgi:putative sterol carrier protein